MTAATLHLVALAATLAIELPIAAAFAPRTRRAEIAVAALFVNLTSHALATALRWLGGDWIALELAVVVVETVAYVLVARISWAHACVISAASNTASAAVALAFVR